MLQLFSFYIFKEPHLMRRVAYLHVSNRSETNKIYRYFENCGSSLWFGNRWKSLEIFSNVKHESTRNESKMTEQEKSAPAYNLMREADPPYNLLVKNFLNIYILGFRAWTWSMCRITVSRSTSSDSTPTDQAVKQHTHRRTDSFEYLRFPKAGVPVFTKVPYSAQPLSE